MQFSAKVVVGYFCSRLFLVTGALLLGLITHSVLAQDIQNSRSSPRLADLMNEAMQVHHTKLAFAGYGGNWDLASYEVSKLKETIVEIKEAIVGIQSTSPLWRRIPAGEMLANIDLSLTKLEKAVSAKDIISFNTAYNELTSACNACHVRAGQPQIRIIIPHSAAGDTFPDQDFKGAGN